MKCALCKEKNANKPNTHYLTDSIIRTALNQDGSNSRETAVSYNMSSDKIFPEFEFQRNTSLKKIISSLGRNASEEEISRAVNQRLFSVDDIFCQTCEDRFTEIETQFKNKLLNKFRGANLDGIDKVEITEIKLFRLFFYLQIWRTAICESMFVISDEIMEKLRQLIYNGFDSDDKEIKEFPLSITYLVTKGGPEEYTCNFVSCTNDRNPNIIIMNDFVIQFYENDHKIMSCDFLKDIFSDKDLANFVNKYEDSFLIKIIENDIRKKFVSNIHLKNAQKTFWSIIKGFINTWEKVYMNLPPIPLVGEFKNRLLYEPLQYEPTRYSKERSIQLISFFIKKIS